MNVKSADFASALLICAATVQAAPVTLIDGATQGRYNQILYNFSSLSLCLSLGFFTFIVQGK